jgi:GNAT superfamily N-acetyltransferase
MMTRVHERAKGMSDGVEIREIKPVGDLYEEERRVRGKVLREPLGMGPTVELFPFEAESWHFVALLEGRIVGCALFHPRGAEGRLYQMAVLEELRGRGIGRRIVDAVEAAVARRGIERIFLHARDYAIPFYAGCGYRGDGEPFFEIGIPHQRMLKSLHPEKN